MARGTEAKKKITEKILNIFPESFIYNGKEIRIPMLEGTETVQVKCVLTCAKVNVESGGDTVVPMIGNTSTTVNSSDDLKITEQEKKETMELLQSLNL